MGKLIVLGIFVWILTMFVGRLLRIAVGACIGGIIGLLAFIAGLFVTITATAAIVVTAALVIIGALLPIFVVRRLIRWLCGR